jgi:hypothetical protein
MQRGNSCPYGRLLMGSVDLTARSVTELEMKRDLLTVITVFVFSLGVYGSKTQLLHDEAGDMRSGVLTVKNFGPPFRHSRGHWSSKAPPWFPQLPIECFPASRADNGPDNQGPPPMPDVEEH